MIKTIIFDFGNVFINLDIENGFRKTLELLKIESLSDDIIKMNKLYEVGQISTDNFIAFYAEKFPHLNNNELIDILNLILKDFPKHRLEFLKQLKSQNNYELILLSNTNELHIKWIKENVSFYNEFKDCFDAFYLSQNIQLRKPNTDIFEFVLKTHQLKANECLFVDDNADNITTAKKMHIHTWHITPYEEDVVDLFSTKKELF